MIDLNCDLGEGCSNDAALFPLIHSANIACGGHAGSPTIMLQSLQLAKQHGVRVGAHPGYMDREHFGRRELTIPADNLLADCVYQIAALEALARHCRLRLAYIKPHGALYNQAQRDSNIATVLIEVAQFFGLPLMGLPQSALAKAAQQAGVGYLAEGFADRKYLPNGQLVPRSEPNAMITDPIEAAQQVKHLQTMGQVETICVHGDQPNVITFLTRLRELLT